MTTVIDAENKVLGRLASKVASKLMDGEEIKIINAEKAMITGKKSSIIEKYKGKKDQGDRYHGPFNPEKPDRMLKKTIEGMLPSNRKKGREALECLKVYQENPQEIEQEEIKSFAESVKINPNKTECMSLKEIIKYI